MIHLDVLLEQNSAKQSYSEQVKWLLQISRWLRFPKDLSNHSIERNRIFSVRIKYLLQLLGRNPTWQENFTQTVSALLQNMSALRLFTSVGMSSQSGFLQDFMDRLQEAILPNSPLTDDLSALLLQVFPTEEESVLVGGIDEQVLAELLALFQNDLILKSSMRAELTASAYLLASQIVTSSWSIQQELFHFSRNPMDWTESKLLGCILKLQSETQSSPSAAVYEMVELCEQRRLKYYEVLQHRGIKVDLIYGLEAQRRRIARLKEILDLLNLEKPHSLHVKLHVSQLILDIHHQKSLRSFFYENLSLLTQRIVQRNSDVGEHYVTFSWREFKKMFMSALGGGALTSLTVYAKLALSSIGLVGFIKGFADSLNYSLSFLGIQACGWTLATKQPSVTAPFLAQSLTRSLSESRAAVVALLRTQFIAVVGNLTSVFPVCFGISMIAFFNDHALLTTEHAHEIFLSTDLLGPSAIYAAFTGCLLFSASIIAGWFENWVALHRLPERIISNERISDSLGVKNALRFADFIGKNSTALAANISLGFLLGLAPQVMKFFGLPLEVRHVTLATGSLAASLPSLFGSDLTAWQAARTVSGILAIGILNISVSFTLALVLASFSSNVRWSTLIGLLKWGVRLVLTRPWLLFVPEKERAVVVGSDT